MWQKRTEGEEVRFMKRILCMFISMCIIQSMIAGCNINSFAQTTVGSAVSLQTENNTDIAIVDEEFIVTAVVTEGDSILEALRVYVNDELLEEIALEGSGSYIISWTPEKTGDFVIYAEIYDDSSGRAVSEMLDITVVENTLVNMIDGVWTASSLPDGAFEMQEGIFKNSEGKKLNDFLPGGWTMENANSSAKVQKAYVDELHSSALSLNLNTHEEYKSFLNNTAINVNGGRFTFAFEFRMNNLTQDLNILAKDSANQQRMALHFDSGSIKANYSGTGESIQADKWYKVQIIFDFDNNLEHLLVCESDGTEIYKGTDRTLEESKLKDLRMIRIQYNTDSGFDGEGHLYIDNMSAYCTYSLAHVEGIYNNETKIEGSVPATISKIVVKSTKELNEESVSSDTVKLYKGYDDNEVTATVSLAEDKKNIEIIPSNVLVSGSMYRVEITEGVKCRDGYTIGTGRKQSFRTTGSSFTVTGESFLNGNTTVKYPMEFSKEDTVKVKFNIDNSGGKAVVAVLAMYDKSGVVQYCTSDLGTPVSGEHTISMTLSNNPTEKSIIKAFLIDKNSGAALCEQVMISQGAKEASLEDSGETSGINAGVNIYTSMIDLKCSGLSASSYVNVIAVSEETESLMAALSDGNAVFVGQYTTDSYGKLNKCIGFLPETMAGKYVIYVTDAQSGTTHKSNAFNFISAEMMETARIAVNNATTETMQDALENNSVVLMLDMSEYSDVKTSAEQKSDIAEMMVNIKPEGGYLITSDITTAFSKCVATVLITENETPDILMNKYSGLLNIDLSGCNDEIIEYASIVLSKKTYLAPKKLTESFKEAKFSAIVSLETMPGKIQEYFLNTYADKLNLNLGIYKTLSRTTPVFSTLVDLDYVSYADAADKFDEAVKAAKAAENEDKKEVSGGSGGAGGGSPAYRVPSEITDTDKSSLTEEKTEMYSDTENVKWAKEAIENLTKRGVLNGYPDGKFYPQNLVSRAEFVKMVVVAFGVEIIGSTTEYVDIRKTDWCAEYVAGAVNAGIIKGISDNLFAPNKSITREDMSLICYRVLKEHGKSYNKNETGTPLDLETVSEYAKEAVETMFQWGIISGYEDMTFKPQENTTRAEAAKLIYNLITVGGI